MNKATSNEIKMISETVTSIAILGHLNKGPTLVEMIAMCDLTAERHPDVVAFEKTPATGDESL